MEKQDELFFQDKEVYLSCIEKVLDHFIDQNNIKSSTALTKSIEKYEFARRALIDGTDLGVIGRNMILMAITFSITNLNNLVNQYDQTAKELQKRYDKILEEFSS